MGAEPLDGQADPRSHRGRGDAQFLADLQAGHPQDVAPMEHLRVSFRNPREQVWRQDLRRGDALDPFLPGESPEHGPFPLAGALLVEAMGQASICAHQLIELGRAEVRAGDKPQALRLLRVHHALFMAEALPGDELTLLSRRLEADSYTVICAAQVVKDMAAEDTEKQPTICAMAIMEVQWLNFLHQYGSLLMCAEWIFSLLLLSTEPVRSHGRR